MRPVLAFLLLAVTSVLAAGEHPVAPPAATVPAGMQLTAAVATDGSGFLTVWNDHRSFGSDFPRIWAVQTSAAGKRSPMILLQDQTVGATPEFSFDPYDDQLTVVWTGAVYLAVWYDWPAGKIHTMRLDRAGHKLDATPRAIATNGRIVGAASDGTRTMVAVQPHYKAAQLLLFDANGEPAHDPIDMAYATYPIALASNGHQFLMIYSAQVTGALPQTYIGPISADGVLGTGIPFDVYYLYSITTDGTDYLIVHRDHLDLLAYYRYDATGKLVGGRRGTDTSTASASAVPYLGGWLVQTAGSGGGVRARHLDHDGVYLDDVPTPGPNTGGVLATNGSQVLYTHKHISTNVWYQQALGSDDDELLQPGPPAQAQPRLSAGGNGYLALWDEARETKELRAARIDVHGTPLDGEGLVVTRNQHYDGSTAAAFDGANYIAAWGDTSPGQCSIRLARITPGGALPDGLAGHLVDYDCATHLALGSGPTECFWSGLSPTAVPGPWSWTEVRSRSPTRCGCRRAASSTKSRWAGTARIGLWPGRARPASMTRTSSSGTRMTPMQRGSVRTARSSTKRLE